MTIDMIHLLLLQGVNERASGNKGNTFRTLELTLCNPQLSILSLPTYISASQQLLVEDRKAQGSLDVKNQHLPQW
jgi:hypothetical protein